MDPTRRAANDPNVTRSPIDAVLRLFSDVRPGEGARITWMMLSVFFLLASYYFVKSARDGLLAGTPVQALSDLELKAYSTMAQGVVFVLLVPVYSLLNRRWHRYSLLWRIQAFFTLNLVLFWLLRPGFLFDDLPWLGVVFYIWAGVFGLLVISQFWAFAADIYDDRRGRRAFPVIALGASAGAVAGAWVAKVLVGEVGIGTHHLLLGATVLLVASAALLLAVRASGDDEPPAGEHDPSVPPLHPPIRGRAHGGMRSAASPPGGNRRKHRTRSDERPRPTVRDRLAGLRLIGRQRYLLGAALMIMMVNWVNTNGENVLFAFVQQHVEASLDGESLDEKQKRREVEDRTTAFYGDFFFWMNLTGLLLQAFLASRLLLYGGFAAILLALPVVALVSYAAMALLPILALIKAMKILENGTSYSLQNTAQHVLWLPTSATVKYQVKPTVDTLFVRAGDLLAAGTVAVGAGVTLALEHYFVLNVALVVVWIGIALVVVRENRARTRQAAHAGADG